MAKVTDEALYQFLTGQMGYSQTEAIRIIGGISTILTKAQATAFYNQFSNTYGGQLNAPTTSTEWSQYKEGDEVTFTHNGRALKRYFYNDNYGNILLAQNADGTNTDFVIKDNTPVYVQQDSSGVWYNPDTNKQFTPYNSQWTDYTPASGLFEGLGATGTLTPEQEANVANTQADTAYRNALTQQLLQEMNNPASTDAERNTAAIQLYGILSDFMASSNATNVNQWGNQAAAFNQAYGNALDQNKWLQEVSTQPINTVAYLNLMRGEMPPNWNLPNFQKMPDAFQGWNQPQPTTQGAPTAEQVIEILKGLGWGQQQTVTPKWQMPNGQTYPTTTPIQDIPGVNVITPQNAPASWSAPKLPVMGGTENAGMSYYNGQWYTPAELHALLTPKSPASAGVNPTGSPSQGGVDYLW